MYSNGSTGGIVNVVDNSIPTLTLRVLAVLWVPKRSRSTRAKPLICRCVAIWVVLNLTYSYQDVDQENYEIPGGAVLDRMKTPRDMKEHEAGDEHEEEHEAGHGEMDTLANSDVSTTSHRLGLSTTGDWGFVGLSYSDLSSTYGIPFHSEAAHEAHGEEHAGEHDGEHAEEEGGGAP